MFSRAGICTRGARIWLIYAKANVIGGRRIGWASLLMFASGDLAWYSKDGEFLCWGMRISIHNILRVPMRIQYGEWPYSDVRTRRAFNEPVPPKPKFQPKPQAQVWEQSKLFA